MTIVSIILLGAGVLLIASSLDNKPIIETTRKILAGGKIDWTGGGGTTTKTTSA